MSIVGEEYVKTKQTNKKSPIIYKQQQHHIKSNKNNGLNTLNIQPTTYLHASKHTNIFLRSSTFYFYVVCIFVFNMGLNQISHFMLQNIHFLFSIDKQNKQKNKIHI